MVQKEKTIEQNGQLKGYAEWLLSELERQGVALSVLSENGLHIKGEITAAQKEHIRLWKRRLIDTLSPSCSECALPMRLINNGSLWFCPLGCGSRKV